VEALGFEEPTPVQRQVIPQLLAGKDVIVQAQTGSGKTAAYGIPIAQMIDGMQPVVQSLVLSPTRELALQVSVHLSQIGQFQGVTVLPVYGGQSYDRQSRALRRGPRWW
jgi:ATP-dependent RNA helicase DeaD